MVHGERFMVIKVASFGFLKVTVEQEWPVDVSLHDDHLSVADRRDIVEYEDAPASR